MSRSWPIVPSPNDPYLDEYIKRYNQPKSYDVMPKVAFADYDKIPLTNPMPGNVRKVFTTKLSRIEQQVNKDVNNLKAFCRICNCELPSHEFYTDHYRWPDLMKHAILEHGCTPDQDFLRYIIRL